MVLKIPPEVKKITPYIRRAEELEKDKSNAESRLVAYYCRQYAVSVGIPLASTSPAAKQCLGDILNDLEKEKEAMSNFTREEAKFLCRAFADKIFEKADAEDRAGGATKITARTFYAAATFFEILQQFYDDSEEASEEREEEKKKTVYSKWKATEILKAIKEGRTPAPGGYGQNEGEEPATDATEDVPPAAPAPASAPPVVEQEEESAPDVFVPPPVNPKPLPPPKSRPAIPPPTVPPPIDDDEGTEVALGPPPAFPGGANNDEDDGSEAKTEHFVPSAPPAPKPAKTPSLFGFVKRTPPRGSGKATKQQLEDAKELTRFALAALDEKDADLAARRLKEALQALGR